jgi:methylthioribulose-1-phosphate dehydratase
MPTGSETKPQRIDESYATLARLLCEVGVDFYRRGWVLGTSGNFSAVAGAEQDADAGSLHAVSDSLRLAITASGADKGALTPDQILLIDSKCQVVSGHGKPSDESKLHLAVVRTRGAGSVLHTHSVWSTLLSEAHARNGRLVIEGFEMLKGLAGVKTHEHEERLPIIENSQDMDALADSLEKALESYPECHGVMLRRHGLYTWGRDLTEAKRHVEILEFLLEVTGRAHFLAS